MANIKRANTSGITKSGAAISDVPDAPTIGAVTDTAAGGTVTVAYTAATTGGAVTTFTATSTPGTITGTGASPITVTGLTDSTAYTFKVKGTNSTATGPESAASSSVTPTSFLVGAYDSIATTTLSSATGSVTFSSIPATYKHLQVRFLAGFSSSGQAVRLQLNGDTAGNYSRHAIGGSSTTLAAFGEVSQVAMTIYGVQTGASTTYSSASITDILDYTNISKYTTMRALAGHEANGSGEIGLFSGSWLNTAAVTSMLIFPSAGNFATGSKFALYGIKGA